MPSRRCRPPSSIAGVITTDPSQSVVHEIAAAIQAAAAGPGGMKRLAGERPRASYAGGIVNCCPASSGRAPVALRSCGGGNSKIRLVSLLGVPQLDNFQLAAQGVRPPGAEMLQKSEWRVWRENEHVN